MSSETAQSGFGSPERLVEVWRGPIVESQHHGHLIAVDPAGETIAALGSPGAVTSSLVSQALQTLPVVAQVLPTGLALRNRNCDCLRLAW
jgi:L-asparaginase II